MKKNMGSTDRVIRVLIAAVIGCVLFFSNAVSGVLAIVLLAVAAIFILTSVVSICPLYMLFGLSTSGKRNTPSQC